MIPSNQWNCKRSKLSVPILRRLLSIAAVAIVLVISSGRGTHFVKNCNDQNWRKERGEQNYIFMLREAITDVVNILLVATFIWTRAV